MPQTKPTSEQVTFLQAGTGATQRTALAKLRDTVSVKDFGDAADTARVTITVSGLGSDTVDVEATETFFQAHYLMR